MNSASDPQEWDAAIVGGGIVGLSSALALQERGLKVALIDPDMPRSRASFGNAGVISRGSVLTMASPAVGKKMFHYAANRDAAVRIRYTAFPYYARWLVHFLKCCNEEAWRRSARALNPFVAAAYDHHVQLAQSIGSTSLIRRNGYLKLYRDRSGFDSSALEREILADAGIRVSILTGSEIRDLEPSLKRPFDSGLFFPDTGSIDSPGRLVELCTEAFRGRGGALLKTKAQSIEPGSQSVTIRLQNDTRVVAKRVVISAGAHSGQLIAPLGYRIPYAAERGYHAHFQLQEGTTLNRTVIDTAASYGTTPVGGTIRLTSGVELARPEDPPNFKQLEAVEREARKVVPMGAMVPDSRWLGSRPSTADGLPVIGCSTRHPRLVFAFGHGHIGLSTGPLTGRIVANLIAGEPAPVPIEPFAIERFD